MQYDAFDIGFITTDDFTNADILEATYPAVAKRLHGDWTSDPAIPIVTGFLGKVLSLTNCFGHLLGGLAKILNILCFFVLYSRVGGLVQLLH